MGAGKTSVGKELSKLVGIPFIDTDVEIEKSEKKTIFEIFAEDGEAFFRKLESQLIDKLSADSSLVVALGGGALINEANRKKLFSSGTVIYLKVSLEILCERISGSLRPLASDAYELFVNRVPFYEAANITVEAGIKNPQMIAEEIAGHLKVVR